MFNQKILMAYFPIDSGFFILDSYLIEYKVSVKVL